MLFSQVAVIAMSSLYPNLQLFGAVVSCPVRISDHFYGTGESFLFSFEGEGKEGEKKRAKEEEEEEDGGTREDEGTEEGDKEDKVKINVYNWTGENHYCIKGNSDSIAIGGGT